MKNFNNEKLLKLLRNAKLLTVVGIIFVLIIVVVVASKGQPHNAVHYGTQVQEQVQEEKQERGQQAQRENTDASGTIEGAANATENTVVSTSSVATTPSKPSNNTQAQEQENDLYWQYMYAPYDIKRISNNTGDIKQLKNWIGYKLLSKEARKKLLDYIKLKGGFGVPPIPSQVVEHYTDFNLKTMLWQIFGPVAMEEYYTVYDNGKVKQVPVYVPTPTASIFQLKPSNSIYYPLAFLSVYLEEYYYKNPPARWYRLQLLPYVAWLMADAPEASSFHASVVLDSKLELKGNYFSDNVKVDVEISFAESSRKTAKKHIYVGVPGPEVYYDNSANVSYFDWDLTDLDFPSNLTGYVQPDDYRKSFSLYYGALTFDYKDWNSLSYFNTDVHKYYPIHKGEELTNELAERLLFPTGTDLIDTGITGEGLQLLLTKIAYFNNDPGITSISIDCSHGFSMGTCSSFVYTFTFTKEIHLPDEVTEQIISEYPYFGFAIEGNKLKVSM